MPIVGIDLGPSNPEAGVLRGWPIIIPSAGEYQFVPMARLSGLLARTRTGAAIGPAPPWAQ